jgi:hypothetical protein
MRSAERWRVRMIAIVEGPGNGTEPGARLTSGISGERSESAACRG